MFYLAALPCLLLSSCGGNSGSPNTNVCTGPAPNGYTVGTALPRIRLTIRRIRIEVRKDNGTPRDDVMCAAFLFHDATPGMGQSINPGTPFKIHNRDVGTWVNWGKGIAEPGLELVPASSIAVLIFDKDPGNTYQTWTYNTVGNHCLTYQSREEAYGEVIIQHSDFAGMQSGETLEYNLDECSIEVTAFIQN